MSVVNLISECSREAASWSSGDTIALFALVVAAITGGIAYGAYRSSLKQFDANRQHNERVLQQNQAHNELAVRPLLDFEIDIWAPDSKAGIWLTNHGFGAAILKGIGATLDGKTYDFFDLRDLRGFSRAIPYATKFRSDKTYSFRTSETHRAPDSAIPTGSRSALVIITKDDSKRFRASLHEAKDLTLWARYEDLYGNKYYATFASNEYDTVSAEEILQVLDRSGPDGDPEHVPVAV